MGTSSGAVVVESIVLDEFEFDGRTVLWLRLDDGAFVGMPVNTSEGDGLSDIQYASADGANACVGSDDNDDARVSIVSVGDFVHGGAVPFLDAGDSAGMFIPGTGASVGSVRVQTSGSKRRMRS